MVSFSFSLSFETFPMRSSFASVGLPPLLSVVAVAFVRTLFPSPLWSGLVLLALASFLPNLHLGSTKIFRLHVTHLFMVASFSDPARPWA